MVEGNVESHNMGPTLYRLTSLWFHVSRPSHSWDMIFFKFDFENPRSSSWVRWTLKITTWVRHYIDSHPFYSMSIGHPIPEIRFFFQIWPWKSKVKIMVEGNVESRKVGVASHRLTSDSFHVNRPFHSLDRAFSKYDLENQRSRSNDHDVAQLQISTISQNPKWHKSILWFQKCGFRKVWPKCCLIWQVFGPWASPYGANGQMTMTLHNYGWRQVHETLKGVNPSSSFRYAFRKDPICSKFDKFLAHGQAHMGQMGK